MLPIFLTTYKILHWASAMFLLGAFFLIPSIHHQIVSLVSVSLILTSHLMRSFFKKKKYFFVRNNDAWERKTLCRWKREKTNVNVMYGLRDGSWTLIIDLLWRKQHFAQIEMLMRWFFTLAKKRHETANIEYEWTDWKCDRNGCHLTLSNSIDNADSMKRSCDMKHYFNGNVF